MLIYFYFWLAYIYGFFLYNGLGGKTCKEKKMNSYLLSK